MMSVSKCVPTKGTDEGHWEMLGNSTCSNNYCEGWQVVNACKTDEIWTRSEARLTVPVSIS